MKYNRTTRRQFLRGAGGFALALPFLPSLAPAATLPAKRFVGIFHANGIVPDKWFPATQATKVLQGPIRELSLTGITGSISDTFNSRFDRYKSKMLMLRGLDCVQRGLLGDFATGHDVNFMLGGKLILNGSGQTVREGNVTIDQVMAQSSKVYPAAPLFRSIQARAHGAWTGGSISFARSGTRVVELPGIDNPVTLFNQLFKNLPSGSGGTSEADKIKLQNKLAVDLVIDDYKTLSQSRKLSSEDKQALNSHVNFLFELENRLKVLAPNLCTAPQTPSGVTQNFSNLDNIAAAQMQNIAAALKCGLTNIATLAFTHFSDNSFYNAAIPGLPNLHHHDLAHSGDKTGLQALRQFWAKHVATLLDLLDVVEDPATGRTFLDNSVIYWGSESHEGESHSQVDMPVVLFGGAGGFLRTGRLIDYRDMTKPTGNSGYTGYCCGKKYYHGRPYNELLVTLLQAMGLSPADYETGGEPGYGDYSYDTPNSKASAAELAPYQLPLGDRRSVLPFIT